MIKFLNKTANNYNLTILCRRLVHNSASLSSLVTDSKDESIPKIEREFFIEKKFIPMTRRTLIRKITQLNHLVKENEKEQFIDFTQSLEHSLSRSYQGVAKELKQLYDPLNPDKETIVAKHVGKKERLDNEFWLLKQLSHQLERANFTEIPRDYLIQVLEEHPVYEGVQVDVDIKKYEVLRAWALSESELPIEVNGYYAKLKYYVNVWFLRWPKSIPIYKRVVLAIRVKKQNKLMLKAFKDIPKNGMEYFLPIGKISMSKFDKGFIATTVSIGALSVLIKVLSSLIEYQVHWTYAIGGVTTFLALKSWNAYKNKRNTYLAKHSKLLYYKTIATNRALLNLIVDRAEDEIFKSALIAYIFIRNENTMKELLLEDEDVVKQITVSELKTNIENWMMNRYQLDIHFNPTNAINQLQNLGLLKLRHIGDNVHLVVLPLEEALSHLPKPISSELIEDSEEVLEVEEIIGENDSEILEAKEKQEQIVEESKTPGWN